MKNQTQNEEDNLSMKDVVVLSAVATATIIGVGALARLGADLYTEGVLKFKARKASKTEAKDQ